MPKPMNYGIPRMRHPVTAEQQIKRDSRAEQGWQQRYPFTLRVVRRPSSPAGLTYSRGALAALAQSRRPR